jgi:hypothetical protein
VHRTQQQQESQTKRQDTRQDTKQTALDVRKQRQQNRLDWQANKNVKILGKRAVQEARRDANLAKIKGKAEVVRARQDAKVSGFNTKIARQQAKQQTIQQQQQSLSPDYNPGSDSLPAEQMFYGTGTHGSEFMSPQIYESAQQPLAPAVIPVYESPSMPAYEQDYEEAEYVDDVDYEEDPYGIYQDEAYQEEADGHYEDSPDQNPGYMEPDYPGSGLSAGWVDTVIKIGKGAVDAALDKKPVDKSKELQAEIDRQRKKIQDLKKQQQQPGIPYPGAPVPVPVKKDNTALYVAGAGVGGLVLGALLLSALKK